MLVDLVRTTTRDGLRLDGAFLAAPAPGCGALDLDAICIVHGAGSNFYSSSLFDVVATRFLELGISILRVNTRGHDGINTVATNDGGQRLGTAFEVVDECRRDLTAWVDWLKQRTGPRIGLVGHSLGAVKCLYALAHEQALTAQCVIAMSPPRLSYSWFCSGPERNFFLDGIARAEERVANGQPNALLEFRIPLFTATAAASYLEKYGPQERYNYLQFLAGVRCPVLLTLGSEEIKHSVAFRDAPEALAALGRHAAHVKVEIVPGADHFYTGLRADLIAKMEGWLNSRRA